MTERPGTLKRDLKWGQTPFDDMSKEELLFEVRRMYAALQSCKTALAFCRRSEGLSPYWTVKGTGGRALRMAEIALAGIAEEERHSERIYRMFYRYAIDLLFGPDMGFGWWVCNGCGDMWGESQGEPAFTECINSLCKDKGKPLRRLNWSDMEPENGQAAEANP